MQFTSAEDGLFNVKTYDGKRGGGKAKTFSKRFVIIIIIGIER